MPAGAKLVKIGEKTEAGYLRYPFSTLRQQRYGGHGDYIYCVFLRVLSFSFNSVLKKNAEGTKLLIPFSVSPFRTAPAREYPAPARALHGAGNKGRAGTPGP